MNEGTTNYAKMTTKLVEQIKALGFVEETHTVNDIEIIDWTYKFGNMGMSIDAWGDAVLTQDGYDEVSISFYGVLDLEGIIEFFKNVFEKGPNNK